MKLPVKLKKVILNNLLGIGIVLLILGFILSIGGGISSALFPRVNQLFENHKWLEYILKVPLGLIWLIYVLWTLGDFFEKYSEGKKSGESQLKQLFMVLGILLILLLYSLYFWYG